MASCRTSVVSILNNDDHPSFAVPSSLKQPRQHATPLYPCQPHQQFQQFQQYQQYQHHHQQQIPDRYPIYPDSSVLAPRLPRPPYDPIPSTGTSLPTSPVLSDCSQDYNSSSRGMPSYHPYSRSDYPYSPPAILPLHKRLSVPYPIDPPSPQPSLRGASRELSSSRSIRKNRYPCPYAASHGCTALFTTSGHAARHGKKHTGEKSVHCPICDKAFTRKDNMKQHVRTHRTDSEEMSVSTMERDDGTGIGTNVGTSVGTGMWMRRPDQLYPTTTVTTGQQNFRPMDPSQTNPSSFHNVTGILSASPSSQIQNNNPGRIAY